jgi:peptidoglycan hydrolase-like protein with peptidoglycan-binding domain
MKNWRDLKRLAEYFGFFVTSTTGGTHNSGSAHFHGLAIDVRTHDHTGEENERFMRQARAIGIIVRDERRRPAGQKVWSGQHLHLQIGEQTENALREYQRRNNLIVDGILGERRYGV